MSLTEINFETEGRFLKTVFVRDEWILPDKNPEDVVSEIQEREINADIYTFVQSIFDREPRYSYFMEWDNVAAIRLSTFDEWFNKKINKSVRNRIKKAKKQGIEVRIEPLNEKLILGMMKIFSETRVRRGRSYPYYGENYESVRRGWAKDLERSDFLVAYYESEIVGFIKLVFGDMCARTTGTISKLSHRNKSPMNALFSAAVERCTSKNYSYLIYGKYTYGKKSEDSLVQFKRHNGFEKIEIPRYFVPMSWKGRIALGTRMHHGLTGVMPRRVIDSLIQLRAGWYKESGKQISK
jgi:hypothetical protein